MIVVGTTLAAMAMSGPDAWSGWLFQAEQLAEKSEPNADIGEVRFFAAIQVDARGLAPFEPLLDRLNDLNNQGFAADYWTYSLDDGRTEIDMQNRLRHITAGQNLVTDYAQGSGATHLLFLASDTSCPPDSLNQLVALRHPYVGGHVPTYGLDGPVVEQYRATHDDDIREHMPSAAFVLLRRDLFRYIRWRHDADVAMSDDPCLYHDAKEFLGVQGIVHHGVVGQHYPPSIGDYKSRGYDTTVVR